MGQMENWHKAWISKARFSTFLREANQDLELAKALYDWNAALSASFLSDLSHLEVGLRNMASGHIDSTGNWLQPEHRDSYIPDIQKNQVTRKNLSDAYKKALPQNYQACHSTKIRHSETCRVGSGKVVAELSFGFWVALTRPQLEKTIWVPHLHKAFPKGSRRSDVFDRLTEINNFRNRVAHHEHVMNDPESKLEKIFEMTEDLSTESQRYLQSRSKTFQLIVSKPT